MRGETHHSSRILAGKIRESTFGLNNLRENAHDRRTAHRKTRCDGNATANLAGSALSIESLVIRGLVIRGLVIRGLLIQGRAIQGRAIQGRPIESLANQGLARGSNRGANDTRNFHRNHRHATPSIRRFRNRREPRCT
ncbi:MAG: hypothetical protein ABIP94_22600 [Planctomycetota bacterium]